MSYLGAGDLIFNNDEDGEIHTGGFSVKSIMMKTGISPIKTLNSNQLGGASQVSDLFSADLVVPNWAYSLDLMNGGKKNYNYDSSDEEDDTIDDDLHNKLLDLVKVHENDLKKKFKKTKKNIKNKKGGTKKYKSKSI
jgi:hypothetical protein